MKDDGGPAFPMPETEHYRTANHGMSLRDYFAGQALTGLVGSGSRKYGGFRTSDDMAKEVWFIADAMLKTRDR